MSIAQQMGQFVQKLKGFDRCLHQVKFISAGNGSIHCELKITNEHVNEMGNMHSGYITTLVDVISGMGLLTYNNGFKPSVSVNINVNYKGEAKVKLISADKGRCLAEFKVDKDHLNYMNGLHGGYSATIVDKYTSAALHTILDDDYQDVTVNLNVSYMKGARLGDDVLVDTRSLKVGKNVAFLEAYLKNKKNDELLMYGSQILFLVKPKQK